MRRYKVANKEELDRVEREKVGKQDGKSLTTNDYTDEDALKVKKVEIIATDLTKHKKDIIENMQIHKGVLPVANTMFWLDTTPE